MNTVTGKNAIIELEVASVFYPVFCCKSFTFDQQQETIEVTDINSAFAREYVPGMTTATLNVTGVTILDNTGGRISITYLMQESVRRTIQNMRIRLTADDATTLQIAFNAIITSNSLSRDFGSYSQSVSGFVITGTPVVSSSITPPGTGPVVQAPLYIDVVAGQSSVHDTLLEAAGVVILEVDRSGIQHDQVSGTPGNREFEFGGVGVGTIIFDPTNLFNAGEVIYILYKK
jgi:predicted secreted protein